MSKTKAASKARKKGAKAEDAEAAGPRSSALWWAGMGCGGVVVLAPGSAVLVAALLAPVPLVALLPQRHGGMRAMQASLLFGLAACVHPLHLLWANESSLAAAIALLRQPMVLPTGWIAVLAGWLVSEAASAILRVHADIVAAGVRRAMMQQITVIEAEWGPMPASAPLPPL